MLLVRQKRILFYLIQLGAAVGLVMTGSSICYTVSKIWKFLCILLHRRYSTFFFLYNYLARYLIFKAKLCMFCSRRTLIIYSFSYSHKSFPIGFSLGFMPFLHRSLDAFN